VNWGALHCNPNKSFAVSRIQRSVQDQKADKRSKSILLYYLPVTDVERN